MRHNYYLAVAVFALSCETGDQADIDPANIPVDETAVDESAVDDSAIDDSVVDDSPVDETTGGENITAEESVLQRNKNLSRDGVFVQPTLTRARAATMVRDRTFDGTVSGNVFASPLYVDGNPGVFVIATENNQISVLDETTGRPRWQRTYGQPAGRTGAGCGNITPLGITSTPVIDLARRNIYFDAVVGTATAITDHVIHAVSLDDGSERPGWPVSARSVVNAGERFNPVLHNQRSALLLVNGVLYVGYSGHLGDCGQYRGWLIGIDTNAPQNIRSFKTGIRGGGIWAPGGPSSDGTNIYVTTGNTFGARTWSGGEAVIRLQAGPVFSGQPRDFFAPTNWMSLDAADLDLGGSGPLIVNAPGFTPSQLVLAFGKDGNVFALDRNNLGGIGAQKAVRRVMNGAIVNASAAVTTPSGTFVTMRGHRSATAVGCPRGSGDLATVRLSGTTISMVWCANNGGQGSPIITTTDELGNGALVWTAGAAGTNKLHAWDAVTGAVVFNGGADTFAAVRALTSPIAVKGRIIVAGDNRVYAFRPQ
jgi:hypothetical protein